ncbi:MAG TPA: type II secretion system secretin GspD [Sedimentisphaerales bacterium]|jgi:general secretion pathway protein D|nr:type II secretion system secretin GspD [Sedimentisphaerales bacterium]HNU30878.1 type II secretion system secretin GspD [Sedimentisphaerales bacterium]
MLNDKGAIRHKTIVVILCVIACLPPVIPPETTAATQMPFLEEPGAKDALISMDFNAVDIRIFIKTIGQLTGINFLVDDKIQGTVTLISPSKIRAADVYAVLESVLQTKGYAAVPSGTLVKIVPRAEATRGEVPTQLGRDPQAISKGDNLITQIIPLQHCDAAQTGTAVSTLLSTGGQVVTFPETNAVVVTDTASSVYRVATIIAALDIAGPQESIEVVQLRHASAKSIAGQVVQIMQRGQVQSRLRRTPTLSQTPLDAPKVVPDDRTNSVVVAGHQADVDAVKQVITKLDVERPVEAGYIHVVHLEHAEAKEVEKAVSTALGRITGVVGAEDREPFQVTSDEGTNSLVVVASSQDYKLVEDMVAKLDVPREQVLIEFQIVEASNNVLSELGFDWATLDQAVANSVRGFGFTNLGPRVEAASGDLQGLGVGLWKGTDGAPQIGVILQALQKNSAVNILSTPHVLTSNHQEAHITVADNVPYVSQSRVTEFDPATPTAIRTFDFKDVGIEMTVRPHVSGTGLVRMEVEASFSKLIEGTTGLGSETPTTAQRKAKTTISIMTGTTVVIGGLMRDDKETIQKKVPLLGDLPLVGVLFRANKDRIQKTNLLLFITPHVLTDRDSLNAMTERKKQEQTSSESAGAKRQP